MKVEKHKHVKEAIQILESLGLPKAQQNERSALCLLAILNLTPNKSWSKSEAPLIGITPIMNWIKENYKKEYAPNTRETIRRQTMHQFVDSGIVLYNPDKPDRPVNSPKAAYQIEPATLELLRTFKTKNWKKNLENYISNRETLISKYAKEREQNLVPVKISDKKRITLSPGEHSELIREIIENFAPRFAPNSTLIYVGDTGDKWGYSNAEKFKELGLKIDLHGKMPDVVLYDLKNNWLILLEAVTSHGPVDSKRHEELTRLFSKAKMKLIFVTAFPNLAILARYLNDIAWETEVWVAESPSHLIHFDGKRYLSPYNHKK